VQGPSGIGPDLGRPPTSLNYFEIYKFQYVDRFEVYPGVSRRHGNVGTGVGTSSR
jgi:hypothetical protein